MATAKTAMLSLRKDHSGEEALCVPAENEYRNIANLIEMMIRAYRKWNDGSYEEALCCPLEILGTIGF